jgi:hypothetical protein
MQWNRGKHDEVFWHLHRLDAASGLNASRHEELLGPDAYRMLFRNYTSQTTHDEMSRKPSNDSFSRHGNVDLR